MKAKSILFLFVLFLATSCLSNHDFSADNTPENFTDIKVPASFDWNTTQKVTCNFTSDDHTSLVSIYLVGAQEPFATFLVGKGINPMTFTLPQSEKSIIVRHQKADALSSPTTLPILHGALTYVVPDDSQDINATAPFNAGSSDGLPNDNSKPGTINIPATGMGTLMFEDLWPNYGDYDFNDMVINYGFRLGLQNQNKATMLFGTIRVCAVGGSLPYELFLQLDGVKGGEIYLDTPVVIDNVSNTVDEVEITHLTPGNPNKDPALFAFTGIKKNANRPDGGSFLNTMQGYEISTADMVTINFMISFRNAIDIEDLTADKFNFFLAKDSKTKSHALREIHLGGYEPSLYGKDLYEELKNQSSWTNQSNRFYYSNHNLVWAINIADEIPHPYEKAKFIDAYPNFVKWAQSGGTTNTDWYKAENRVSKHLVPLT